VKAAQGRASTNKAKKRSKKPADVVVVILRTVPIAKMCSGARSAVGANPSWIAKVKLVQVKSRA